LSFRYHVAYACTIQKRIRCRKCRSLNTQRYGKGRVHCKACNYTFRPVKKHHKKDIRWLKSYLLDGSTFRRLGERWKVGYVTAWRRIQRNLNGKVDTDTLIVFKLPKEIPIIYLDAKHFKIRKKQYTLYVSFDHQTSKPLVILLLPEYEDRNGYDQILKFLRTRLFNVKAIVSDADQSIKASVRQYYLNAVHQKCAFHLLARVFRKINGRRLINTQYGRKIWGVIRKIVLEYDDEQKARKYFFKVKKKYSQYPKAWKTLERNLNGVYQFTENLSLNIPRTSNRIENFMGRIEQRLKTMRTSKNPAALIRIIVEFIRFKYKLPTKR